MLKEHLLQKIWDYANSSGVKSYLFVNGQVQVEFLAQGEYNLNFLLRTSRENFVLRINTASQMRLDHQIVYEYQSLGLLNRSGVTPRPYFFDDNRENIPYGLLVMEYLAGEPLDYRFDLQKGAETFARIHGLQYKNGETNFLLKNNGPFSGIYEEAVDLLQKYFACPQADFQIQRLLEKVLLKAEEKKKEERYLLNEPWLTVINTEVNSHNFIVNRERGTCHLIDWEKPIFGEPAQDLSMFLISTTTMWKRNYILTSEEKQIFIRQYLSKLPDCPHKNTLRARIEMFTFFNYLRAISWCAMAWTEYIKDERELVNRDTFDKIKKYLEPEYIKHIFPQVFDSYYWA